MDITQSKTKLLITSKQKRLRLFCKIHKKSILFIMIPLILLPVAFMGNSNRCQRPLPHLSPSRNLLLTLYPADQRISIFVLRNKRPKSYLCFYVFLITASYWICEVLHPAIISLFPIALSTIMNSFGYEIMSFINIHHAMFDCFGILMFILAIEDCHINRRIALKTLLIFGCSHYRLCFLLFFTTMILSMWISNTLACGFMIPIVKAIMIELEKLGILEVYETKGGDVQRRKANSAPRPTDFTVFYFLGIAYSSSIGGMATVVGSHTNQIFKAYSETLFPHAPKIEFPQFVLLTLPGVLIMETALYLWMNFYFLGLFRIHNYSALHTGSTEEEAQFAKTLLSNQYQKLGKITDKELIVGVTILLCGLFQMITSTYLCNHNRNDSISHIQISTPTILCTIVFFTIPSNLDFLRFWKKRSDQDLNRLRPSSRKPCLDWKTVQNEVHWNVLLVIGGSCAMFEALKQSKMTDEFEKFLQIFSKWSAVVLVLVVVILCKILTEFASNICVVHCMLDHVTKVSLTSRVNPHYLMVATILSSSVPFHLITGTPAYAMVSSYFNIPHRRMIYAGIGPTIISIFVIWFTVTVWSKVIWTDVNVFPEWANYKRNITILL